MLTRHRMCRESRNSIFQQSRCSFPGSFLGMNLSLCHKCFQRHRSSLHQVIHSIIHSFRQSCESLSPHLFHTVEKCALAIAVAAQGFFAAKGFRCSRARLNRAIVVVVRAATAHTTTFKRSIISSNPKGKRRAPRRHKTLHSLFILEAILITPVHKQASFHL